MYYRNNKFRSRRSNGRGQRNFRIKSFDPSNIVKNMPVFEQEEYKLEHAFFDFAISGKIKSNISKCGFVNPTPIQDRVVPVVLENKDVVGIANTGTGKTAAFLIPLINKVYLDRNSRILIITPTRELAVQIDKEFRALSQGLNLYSTVCIGGVSIRGQINSLRRRPSFVVGTPGRLLDLYNQKKLDFFHFNNVVLDEVDRMLDMGFIDDIKKIVFKLPRNRQSLFFSATFNERTKSIMSDFSNNPVIISVKSQDASSNVHQEIVALKNRNKVNVLSEILDKKEVEKTLVFVRTKRGADSLNRRLNSVGFKTAVMHGNKTQNQRQRSLQQFKEGRVNVLIATDVASRGIDVNNITHVINYDLPESYEVYIHRIGRTGRVGKKGEALTFIN